jgi:hypothetical protein
VDLYPPLPARKSDAQAQCGDNAALRLLA